MIVGNHRWSWPVLLFACSATVLVSFRHTLSLMVDTWYSSRTYSHCFLILPLFIYLVWVRREAIVDLKPVPNYWGLPLLVVLAAIWILGNLAEARVVQEFAVLAILIVVVETLLGTAAVRAFAFPLFFLFFAVPFGTSLIKPLQNFTAWFVIHALTVSSVPAVLEGHTISLPTAVWEVAEACSGIRFLLSAVVMGTVFSFLMYQSRWRRLVFICASIIVPIVGNGLRAYGIIVLAYLSNNKLAAGLDHIVYGGIFSVFIELVLLAIGLRWREKREPIRRIAAAPAHRADLPGKTAFSVAAGVIAVIVVAPLIAAHLWNRATIATDWADPPVIVTAPWQMTAASPGDWASEWHNPDREFRQSYQHATDRVDLDWVLFSGRQGVDVLDTSVADSETDTIDDIENAIVGGQAIRVHRSLIESGRASRAVWTWYCVSGEQTASRALVRFLQAKARILGKSAAVAVITLGVESSTNASEAERALREFLLHASFASRSRSAPSS